MPQPRADGAAPPVSEAEVFKLRAAIREEELKAERARMAASEAAVRREARRQAEWEKAQGWDSAGGGAGGGTLPFGLDRLGLPRAVVVVAAIAVTALAVVGIVRVIGENAVDKTMANLGLLPGAFTLEQKKHLEEKHKLLKLAETPPLWAMQEGIEMKKDLIKKSRKFGLNVKGMVDEIGQKDFKEEKRKLDKLKHKREIRLKALGYKCPTRLFRYQCGWGVLDPVERNRKFRKDHGCKEIMSFCEFDEDGVFTKRTYCGNLWPAPCEKETERVRVGIARWMPREFFGPRHNLNDERKVELLTTPSPPPRPGIVPDEMKDWVQESPPPPVKALAWVRSNSLRVGLDGPIPRPNNYDPALGR